MEPSSTHRSIPMSRPDDYDRLPMAIRQYYTRQEYLFLTDEQKTNLQRTETEPDPE